MAQTKSHNWNVLKKRGLQEGCVLCATEVRQDGTQLKHPSTPAPTKKFTSQHASSPEERWWSGWGCAADKISTGLLNGSVFFSWNVFSKQKFVKYVPALLDGVSFKDLLLAVISGSSFTCLCMSWNNSFCSLGTRCAILLFLCTLLQFCFQVSLRIWITGGSSS